MSSLHGLGVVKTVKWGEFPEMELEWNEAANVKLSYAHPNRKREWVLARMALKLAFEEFKLDFTSKHEFIGHHHLKGLPGFSFSLSHTLERGGVWLVPGLDENERLGFDIELKKRTLTPSVLERFSHPLDKTNLSPLELWTVKEAAFKSLPKETQENIWLNSIQVQDGIYSMNDAHGEWATETKDDLILTRALLRL